MARGTLFLDTSILIDFFRKEDKRKTQFYHLSRQYESFAVSVISQYEIYVGSRDNQDLFWDKFFDKITIMPLDEVIVRKAIEIYRDLKAVNQLLNIPDILIAATAMSHELPIATLNQAHFGRISGLKLLPKDDLG